MNKTTYTRFFETYLTEVARGHGDREHLNPALRFAKRAESGALERWSDEVYERRLRSAEALAALWQGAPSRTASDLLCSALAQTKPDGPVLRRLSDLLADCRLSMEDSSFLDDDWLKDGEASEQAYGTAEKKPRRLPSPELYSGGSKEPPARQISHLKEPSAQQLHSPKEIYDQVKKSIYGQQDAVREAALLLFNHQQGRKRNILFLGQTGCGKTEIWRVCKQLYPGIRIIDSTAITGEGWKGSYKVRNIFDGMTKEEAEHAIIVLDEFDKLCEPQITSGGSNASLIVQNELLKLIEGTTIQFKDFSVDTSNISFVFCGSFEHLTQVKTDREAKQSMGFGAKLERRDNHRVYGTALKLADLVEYASVRREIAGRIQQIVQLAPMSAEDFRAILADEQISPLRKLEREYGVKLRLDEETAGELVREAAETRMGVRYLYSRIQQMLDDQIFWDCDRTEYELGA